MKSVVKHPRLSAEALAKEDPPIPPSLTSFPYVKNLAPVPAPIRVHSRFQPRFLYVAPFAPFA